MDLIQGNGYHDAELMIIGDYSRKSDSTNQQCLSGYYFKKINELLKQNGFSIDKTYRTCIVKSYVLGLGTGSWGQDKKLLAKHYEETAASEQYYINLLVEEINQVKPTVILALGEYALQLLTGKQGITKWRGSVLGLVAEIESSIRATNSHIKIVPAEHLGQLHQQEEKEFIMALDYKKAIDLVFTPDKPIDYHEVNIAHSAADYLRFRGQYPDHPKRMVTDIETHLGFITCASVSFDGIRGCTIPMAGARIDIMDKCRMMRMLALDLEDPLIAKGNQNMNYDKHIYQRYGYRVEPITWDTMLAAHTIACEFPKSLAFLTSIYTDMSFYKDEGREFDPSKHSYDQLYGYCCKDSISDFQIWDKQIQDLKDLDQLEFFTDFVMPLFNMYYYMECVGIKRDEIKRRDLNIKYEGLYDLKYLELKSIIGRDINVDSPSQIGKYMDENKFPVLRHRTPSGFMIPNTDLNSMNKMLKAEPSEYKNCLVPYPVATRFIELILLLRRLDKVLEYVNAVSHPDGRMHTSVKIAGTSSGRTANGQTADTIPIPKMVKGEIKYVNKSMGAAFQTVTKHGFIVEDDEGGIEEGIIGKDVREMYVPDHGMALIEVDRSQAEARVCDLLAEDYEGLEEYGKLDKHCKVASMIFTDYTYEDIFRLAKKEKTELGQFMRFIGKKGKHANNLDVGPFVLSMAANITFKEAKNILTRLDRAYPKTKGVFHAGVEEIVRNTRTLWNTYGRKRIFYKKLDGHGIKVAYSWLPQSIISDGTKLAALKTWDSIDRNKAWLVGENHDSITALVKGNYIRKYVEIVVKNLTAPIDFRNCVMPRDYNLVIPVDVSIGRRNWSDMKELKLKRIRIAA